MLTSSVFLETSIPNIPSITVLSFHFVSSRELRFEQPCTQDLRSRASQDTVQSEQRSLEKRGLIYRTGSFAKGTKEAHRSPRCSANVFIRQAVRNVQGTRIAPRPPHRSRRALLTHRAPPSGRTSAASGLNPSAVRRTAANRIDVAIRLCVRTTAVCRLFPLGEALPSTTSAGSCLPLFDRFIGTMASSDFSSTYMLGV